MTGVCYVQCRMIPMDSDTFRSALSHFASGITVVTARDRTGADHGMTVSAFSSVSLNPPLVLVCIDHDATALPHIREAERFGVSILAADQADVATRFAQQGTDRFDDVSFTRANDGPALINGAAAHLLCRIVAEHPGGDHVILVGEVEWGAVHGDHLLVYAMRQFGRFSGLKTPEA